MPSIQQPLNKTPDCKCCGRKNIRKRVPWPKPGNELYVAFLCPYCDLNEPDPEREAKKK